MDVDQMVVDQMDVDQMSGHLLQAMTHDDFGCYRENM